MPEQLPASIAELRDRVDALARETLAPLRDDATLAGAPRTAQVRAASKAAGVFGMTQPKDLGGSEAGALALTVVRDTLAAHNVVHLSGLFGPGPGVLAGATAPLRSSHLAPLLAGEKRAAFGFTEPENAERATWGRLTGDTLLVNGQKSYVTGGADADFINTLVNVEGHGPALVVIDRRTRGVEVAQTFGSMDGTRHAHMVFRDVEVPAAHIVGKPGEGLPRAMRQIGDTRLAFAAEAVGLARWVIGFVTDHIQAPHRSGQPLGAREGVRLRYADMRIRAYAARSMVYRTARVADAAQRAGAPKNAINEVIATKVFATEVVGDIVDWGIQLVGGVALRVGHPLEALHRRVRAMRIAEGASDVLRLNLARGKLDLGKGRI